MTLARTASVLFLIAACGGDDDGSAGDGAADAGPASDGDTAPDASSARSDVVWSLSLGNAPAWTELHPAGPAPSARATFGGAFDPGQMRFVVFGGAPADGIDLPFDDVWILTTLNAPAWTQVSPVGTGPSARFRHSVVYDANNQRAIVFGGRTAASYVNDVWMLDLAGSPTWTPLAPAGTPPSGRGWHRAIFDVARQRMVVYGGRTDTGDVNEVWALELAGPPTWTNLTPSGGPSSREYESVDYDAVNDRLLLFGGFMGGGELEDLWALSMGGGGMWSLLLATGPPPAARAMHASVMTFGNGNDRLVVVGGNANMGNTRFTDAWTLSLGASAVWTQLSPTGMPPAQEFPLAGFDAMCNCMIVVGLLR